MAYGFSRYRVFPELVDELTGQDEIEKVVHVSQQGGVDRVLPDSSPENGEYLHASEQRAVAIAKRGRRGGSNPRRRVQRHNANRMLQRAAGLFAFFCSSRCSHRGLLRSCPKRIGLGEGSRP